MNKSKIIILVVVIIFSSIGLYVHDMMSEVGYAKREVKRYLIDPASAKFEDVEFKELTGAVCGLVNSKNRMGGYTGNTPFFYNDAVGVMFIEKQPGEDEFLSYRHSLTKDDVFSKLRDRCVGGIEFKKNCGFKIFNEYPNRICTEIIEGKDILDIYNFIENNYQ